MIVPIIKSKPKSSIKYQFLASFVVNLLAISYGVACGWVSPNILFFMSDRTPLSGKITMEEASWLASLPNFGGLIGNIIFGFITAKYGRKLPLIFFAFPTIISWLLVLYAEDVFAIYIARLIMGIIGGGVYVIIPLFVSEISSDRYRGSLGSIIVMFTNVGILWAFFCGNFIDYCIIPKFVIALNLLFVALFIAFPESPSYLVKQGKLAEAEKSFQFYQNITTTSKNEVNHLNQSELLKPEFADCKTVKCSSNSFKWCDVITNPGRKAFIIGISLSLLNQCSGCVAMLSYTSSIFKEAAGSSVDPNISTLFVGAIQLMGSLLTTHLVDRAGRKSLLAISSIGAALGYIVLGTYMFMKTLGYDVEHINWLPIASFSFIIFIATCGILSLPYVILAEIMPENLRDFGASFCTGLIWFLAFIVTKCLPSLTEALGIHGAMFLFSFICLVSAILTIIYLPETKGKSYEEIMKMLQ